MKWVRLWEGGPKFAEYNVGVTDGKAESYGGYYCWGKATDKDSQGAYKDGTSALTGTDDTATNLWGDNWRMPKKAELEALLDTNNCKFTWTKDYNGTGVKGLLCTGKGAYASNSVFLPAAGFCDGGDVRGQGVGNYFRGNGYSVRAVLAE